MKNNISVTDRRTRIAVGIGLTTVGLAILSSTGSATCWRLQARSVVSAPAGIHTNWQPLVRVTIPFVSVSGCPDLGMILYS